MKKSVSWLLTGTGIHSHKTTHSFRHKACSRTNKPQVLCLLFLIVYQQLPVASFPNHNHCVTLCYVIYAFGKVSLNKQRNKQKQLMAFRVAAICLLRLFYNRDKVVLLLYLKLFIIMTCVCITFTLVVFVSQLLAW